MREGAAPVTDCEAQIQKKTRCCGLAVKKKGSELP